MKFEVMQESHWHDVKRIYEEGINTGHATFETKVPDWDRWDKGHLTKCRIVAIDENGVKGWAALSPVSTRSVYSGVDEVSVYVTNETRGQGLGKKLLKKLVEESEASGIWTLQASIFPENEASIHIHSQNGFRILGRRERIAQMNGIWRDTIIMERRSKLVGLNLKH